MLAADISDELASLRFPLYATPKLDGVRALVFPGTGLLSRSMKPIPNLFTQAMFGTDPDLAGLDGELIVGSPTAADVYRKTNSAVSRKEGAEQVSFHVFDRYDMPSADYTFRRESVAIAVDNSFTPDIVVVPSKYCYEMEDLDNAEAEFLEQGYEGVILRNPESLYKNGRSTCKEQGMLKLKRFEDSEAVILSMEEEMENRNEAKQNELGQTARSAHKENLVGKNRMGALVVRDVKSGVEFKCGTGFTAADRTMFWSDRDGSTGKTIKYKFFPIGVKDKPRHPTYVGMREEWDT